MNMESRILLRNLLDAGDIMVSTDIFWSHTSQAEGVANGGSVDTVIEKVVCSREMLEHIQKVEVCKDCKVGAFRRAT